MTSPKKRAKKRTPNLIVSPKRIVSVTTSTGYREPEPWKDPYLMGTEIKIGRRELAEEIQRLKDQPPLSGKRIWWTPQRICLILMCLFCILFIPFNGRIGIVLGIFVFVQWAVTYHYMDYGYRKDGTMRVWPWEFVNSFHEHGKIHPDKKKFLSPYDPWLKPKTFGTPSEFVVKYKLATSILISLVVCCLTWFPLAYWSDFEYTGEHWNYLYIFMIVCVPIGTRLVYLNLTKK